MKTMKQRYFLLSFAMVACMAILVSLLIMSATPARAQIWEPEGLNMPGAWNSWNNPPSNLALASYTQVAGGRVTRINIGTPRWQTIFSVGAAGDILPGNYNWLFTSGPTSNPWGNKWANVNVIMNTLQVYTYNNGADNNITVADGKWYTMNWEDAGYNDTRAIFMETSAEPVSISSVTSPAGTVNPSTPVDVTVTLSQAKSVEEYFFLRYSSDAWATSAILSVPITGTTGTAQIPGFPTGTTVSYYVFSSTLMTILSDFDLYTIKMNNNGGTNYSYVVQEQSGVPTNRELTNITILPEETLCYDATQTITLAGNGTTFTVQSTGSVNLVAGMNIIMLPGTTVQNGGNMLAHITTTATYCGIPGDNLMNSPVQKADAGWLVYPNPARDIVTIEKKFNGNGEQARAELINLQGRIVQTLDLAGIASMQVSGLPAGAYYLRIITDGSVITKLIIKN